MPTYDLAPVEIVDVVQRMMKLYHEELVKLEVKIDCLVAYPNRTDNGTQTGEAIMIGGYKAAACIRKLGLKDRVAGRGDAEITFDYEYWKDLSDPEKNALADHELTHVELVPNKKEGGFKLDDAGRPKLRMRLHDHQFGWFDAVVRRHADASNEAQQFKEFVAGPLKQLWLPNMNEEGALKTLLFGKAAKAKPRGKDAAVAD